MFSLPYPSSTIDANSQKPRKTKNSLKFETHSVSLSIHPSHSLSTFTFPSGVGDEGGDISASSPIRASHFSDDYRNHFSSLSSPQRSKFVVSSPQVLEFARLARIAYCG
ncbi:hypothetical protein AKJ16_DCAP16569 [Drosera capensis]